MKPSAFTQLRYLGSDVKRIVGGKRQRWYSVWFMAPFLVVLSYRFNRFMYLLLGRGWVFAHFLLAPLRLLIRPWLGGCDIPFTADIGPGFRILHTELGVVISGKTKAGKNLQLVGGNCIGLRGRSGEIRIGDNVSLGAAANILGPITIGSNVKIGMATLVLEDTPDNVSLVGVPARIGRRKNNV